MLKTIWKDSQNGVFGFHFKGNQSIYKHTFDVWKNYIHPFAGFFKIFYQFWGFGTKLRDAIKHGILGIESTFVARLLLKKIAHAIWFVAQVTKMIFELLQQCSYS